MTLPPTSEVRGIGRRRMAFSTIKTELSRPDFQGSRKRAACATSLFFAEYCLMNHSTLTAAQLSEPLRAYALTVEEAAPGEFKWRILESHASRAVFESVCCSESTFTAYDTALASGYGELQRLIGPDLQFGPRREPQAARRHAQRSVPSLAAVATSPSPDRFGSMARRPVATGGQLDKPVRA